jgi:cytochrome P450
MRRLASGVVDQTLRYHRDPVGFVDSAREEHGDVFIVRLLTARPLFFVTDPEAVGRLVDADGHGARAGDARREILPFASQRSVFGGDADAHRSAKARIAPAFAPERLAGLRPAMAEVAAEHADQWPRDRPFQLLPRVRKLTDEIFLRFVLGIREEATVHALIAAIRRMLWTPGNPPLTLPGNGDGLAGQVGEAIFARRRAPVAALLSRAIDARRGGPQTQDDAIGCLLAGEPQLDTEAMVDELLSTVMAAQEPPAIALTWLLDRLSRNSGLIDGFLADPCSELSDAIVRETLRLQPSASAVLRKLTEPMAAGDCVLPVGANTVVPLPAVHCDPRHFDQPDAFHPERWLRPGADSRFLIPFGGGARRCVGEPLAHAEIESALPAMLGRIRLRPVSGIPERMVVRGTVLVPRYGALVSAV